MRIGEVELLPSTAEALDGLGLGHVGRVNVNLEQMAWLVRILRALPDDEKRFPHGKWATIQNIENQLDYSAAETAKEIGAR